MNTLRACICGCGWAVLLANAVSATPPGFVKTTIPLDGAVAGLAFDASGTLYALEGADFNQNAATLRIIQPDGAFGASFPVTGANPNNFFVGSMTFDPIGNRVLITDNTFIDANDPGRVYAISTLGVQQTIATGIANVAGIAVRGTGEIFVSTAEGSGNGTVLQIDRASGNLSTVPIALDFGAGLEFDGEGSLIVQNADNSFVGSLQRLSMTSTDGGGLTIGAPQPLLGGMVSTAAVIHAGDEFYTTGFGGLYRVAGEPLSETEFDPNEGDFATALAFYPGAQPFEMFSGPGGGKLVYSAHYGDTFVTILTPAEPGDYNGDGHVTSSDYAAWRGAFGANDPSADGNRDGLVDVSDYVLWRKNSSPASVSAASMICVAEPASMAGAITAILVFATTLRQRSASNHRAQTSSLTRWKGRLLGSRNTQCFE